MSDAIKMVGAALLMVIAGAAAILLFEGVWTRVGLGAACIIVVGGLLLLAWRVDRKDKSKRAGIEELPRV